MAFDFRNLAFGQSSDEVMASLLRWQESVFDRIFQLNPTASPTLRKGFEVPLHMLPISERITAMRQYRDIIGLDEFLIGLSQHDVGGEVPAQLVSRYGQTRAREIFNVTQNLHSLKGLNADAPYYKVPVGYRPGDHVLGAIYSGMNINFDETPRDLRFGMPYSQSAGSVAAHFGPGINRIRTISQDLLNMPSKLREGASFLSFDIETAGLMKNQISNISFRSGVVGAGGSIADGEIQRLLFNPIAMQRGIVGNNKTILGKPYVKGAIPLSRSVARSVGVAMSDDFASSMVPFLERLRDVDYIVGFNQTGFDLPQILSQLTESSAYRDRTQSVIPGFRSLVDDAFSKLDSRVVDIHTLVSRAANLSGLGVAPELLSMGDARPFSIANILLQTNLLDLTENSELKDLITSAGLHDARVDDLATISIFQHLDGLTPAKLSDQTLRSAILTSSAPTPFTKASSHLDVEDRALKYLIGRVEGGVRVPLGEGTPQENRKLAALLQQARMGNKTAAKEAFKMIRNGVGEGLSFDITPIEQQVFGTRRLGLGAGVLDQFDPQSYIFKGDTFMAMMRRGMSGRKNYEKIISGQRGDVSGQEFSAFQKQLADANLPFAGLSLEERRLATGLSALTAHIDPRFAKNVSHMLPNSLVANWQLFDPGSVQYATRSGRSSMPVGLLERYGLLQQGDGLSFSIVDETVGGGKSAVNLRYKFKSDQEVESFIENLKKLAGSTDDVIAEALGFDPTMLDVAGKRVDDAVSNFRYSIQNSQFLENLAKEKAVDIGQLYGRQATPVIRAFREFFGRDQLRDEDLMNIVLPFARTSRIDSETATGVIQTAGAVLNKGLNANDATNVVSNTRAASEVYERFLQLGKDQSKKIMLHGAQLASEMGAEDLAIRAFNRYQSVRGKIPKAAGAAALFGIGMHFFNKYREDKPFNDTFSQMPIESNDRTRVADLLQAKMDSGVNLSYQRYDPLSTAYVVGDLDSGKVGHTSMAWDKDSNLYGGVL